MINYFDTKEYVEEKIRLIKACIKSRESQIEEYEDMKQETRKPTRIPKYDNEIFRLNEEIYELNKELEEYKEKLGSFGHGR